MYSRSIVSLESLIDTYVATNPRSRALYERAQKAEPGGNSRTATFFRPFPLFAERGEGVYIIDPDGNRRLDFVNNNTSLMLGHAHPAVVKALQEQAARGTAFSRATELELQLAEMLKERLPSLASLRFCNSGTEAVLNALRVAKAYTGRHKVAKCEGAYHGVADQMMVSVNPPLGPAAGPDHRPQPVPSTAGLSPADLAEVVLFPYNDTANTVRIVEDHAHELAAVILDPLMTQSCLVPPEPGYLESLREVTARRGIVLIYDEVISFRAGPGGMQELTGVRPDLTTLAKVPMGGMPGGVWGGRADIMALYDPSQGTPLLQQSGTFNGNPMTMAAGIATLAEMTPAAYARLDGLGQRLRGGLNNLFRELTLPAQATGMGSLYWIHFLAAPPRNYRATLRDDAAAQQRLFFWLLNHGILTYNKGMGCLSLPMAEEHVDLLINSVRDALLETGIAGA